MLRPQRQAGHDVRVAGRTAVINGSGSGQDRLERRLRTAAGRELAQATRVGRLAER